MIIISTSCITLIDIHYPRVQKYIVYWKGLKLIRRGVDSWAVFLLRPVNKVYSGLQDKEKGSSLGGLFTDYFFFWLQGATLLFTYHFVFNSSIPLQPLISMTKSFSVNKPIK